MPERKFKFKILFTKETLRTQRREKGQGVKTGFGRSAFRLTTYLKHCVTLKSDLQNLKAEKSHSKYLSKAG